MNGRRIAVGLVALAAGAGLIGAAAPAASAAATGAVASASVQVDNPAGTVRALYTAKGFQALIDSVTDQVQAEYPGAALVFVDSESAVPTKQVKDLTGWVFLFNAVVGSEAKIVFATVTLPSWTAQIRSEDGVFAGVYPITTPVAVSPFEASVRLRTAGYRGAFERISLYRNNPDPAPNYWFDLTSGGEGIVNAVTGDVILVP
jgi:hypothetical protein